MKFKLISFVVFGASLWAGNQPPVLEPIAFNINSRYTVESVELSREIEGSISRSLRQDLRQLIGEKFNSTALNNMARRIRDELHVRTVTHRVLRGNNPEHVKVVLEVSHRRGEFELSVPKFVYHSSQGWSGAVDCASSGAVRIATSKAPIRHVASDFESVATADGAIY